MQFLMVRFDDGTWLSSVTTDFKISTVANWTDAKMFIFDHATDLEHIIRKVKAGTVYSVEVPTPRPTALSTDGQQIGKPSISDKKKGIRKLNFFG